MVRSDSRFDDYSLYHYVEIPDGDKYENLPAEKIAKKSLHSILSLAPALLVDAKVSKAEKAILLRYLIHAVGDVHMLLHVSNGLDRGVCLVKWKDPFLRRTITMNLHTMWDEGLLEYAESKFREKAQPYPGQKRFYRYQEFLKQTLDSESALSLENTAIFTDSDKTLLF